MTEDDLYHLTDEQLEQEVHNSSATEENSVSSTEEEATTPQEEIVDEKTNSDEDTSNEDTTTEDETPSQESASIPESYRIKADGTEYDFTIDELLQLAPKAMNYTKKMQTIAPHRKLINTIEENQLTEDDINTLIDIKSGNKKALGALIKATGVDIYDIDTDTEAKYKPTEHGKSKEYLALEDTIKEISTHKDYPKTQEIMTNIFDNTSKEILFSNPELVSGLHVDVTDGTYDKVMPQAKKLAVLDGYKKPILEYYIQAGNNYHEQSKRKQEETTKAKKSASLPKQSSKEAKVTDYLNELEDDPDYNEWYKKLQQNY